jgi:hypothetical protein
MGKFLFRKPYLTKQKSQSYEIWCDEISCHDLQKLSSVAIFRNRCNSKEIPKILYKKSNVSFQLIIFSKKMQF